MVFIAPNEACLAEAKQRYEDQFIFCESRLGDTPSAIVNGELINRKFNKGTGIKAICDELASAIPVENGLSISSRSVMGVEIPTVTLEPSSPMKNYYGFYSTNSMLDEAYFKFDRVKKLTTELLEIENSVYRLATAISKTQKRANALKNIVIPRFKNQIATISESLEEKEMEEHSRLKMIKKQKEE